MLRLVSYSHRINRSILSSCSCSSSSIQIPLRGLKATSNQGPQELRTPDREAAKEPFKDAARQTSEYMSTAKQQGKETMDTMKQKGQETMGKMKEKGQKMMDQMGGSDEQEQTQGRQANPDRHSVIDLIKHDHIRIGRLYRIFEQTVEPESRLLMGQTVIRELCIHSNAEEMIVYPIVDSDVRHEDAEKARSDHLSLEKILKELDYMNKWTITYDEKMDEAIKVFRYHIDFEENILAKHLISKKNIDELIQMGTDFETAKEIAPTRPHPMAPKKGIMGMAAKLSAKPVDEIRDSIRFAGRENDVEAAKTRAETQPNA